MDLTPDVLTACLRRIATVLRAQRQYLTDLATEAGVKDADSLSLQLSLLIEGAIQAEQMRRGSGAVKYAKKAAKILIDSALKDSR